MEDIKGGGKRNVTQIFFFCPDEELCGEVEGKKKASERKRDLGNLICYNFVSPMQSIFQPQWITQYYHTPKHILTHLYNFAYVILAVQNALSHSPHLKKKSYFSVVQPCRGFR